MQYIFRFDGAVNTSKQAAMFSMDNVGLIGMLYGIIFICINDVLHNYGLFNMN